MDKLEGVTIQGEKIGFEKKAGKDNKMVVNLYMLAGFDSIKLIVKDNDLMNKLDKIPDRQPVAVKSEVGVYNGKMYIIAKELMN